MNFSRSDPSPGTSTTTATTASTTAARRTSERRNRDAENSSGSGSASTSTAGSRYSTVKLGRALIQTGLSGPEPRAVALRSKRRLGGGLAVRHAEALALPPGALRALPGSGDHTAGSRTVHAEGGCVAFTLRCYVDVEAPIEVRVVVTGHYLLTLHAEQLALPALLELDVSQERSRRYVVYSVLDAILESTFGALDEVELRLEGLAATWAAGGGAYRGRCSRRRAPGSRTCGAG